MDNVVKTFTRTGIWCAPLSPEGFELPCVISFRLTYVTNNMLVVLDFQVEFAILLIATQFISTWRMWHLIYILVISLLLLCTQKVNSCDISGRFINPHVKQIWIRPLFKDFLMNVTCLFVYIGWCSYALM